MCVGLPIILSTWSKCDASNYLAKGKILIVEPCRNMRACTFVEKYLIPSSLVNPKKPLNSHRSPASLGFLVLATPDRVLDSLVLDATPSQGSPEVKAP